MANGKDAPQTWFCKIVEGSSDTDSRITTARLSVRVRVPGNPGRNPRLWGGQYSINTILEEGFERDCVPDYYWYLVKLWSYMNLFEI